MRQGLRKYAGLDAQVLSTLLFRSWQIVAGGLIVVLIPIYLGRIEQGYFYTFAGLLGLQVFFELGINQVILQLVSHDFAHVDSSNPKKLSGDKFRLSRLNSLVRVIGRWYGIISILFFVVVGIGGVWFFLYKGELPITRWLGPWILLTFASAMNLFLSANLTVMEGCGEIASVARMRLTQSLIGSVLMWVALACGVELWAISVVPITSVLYTAFWLRSNDRRLKGLRQITLPDHTIQTSLNWKRDILPFQWRIAVSWISGYFMYQLFTPLVFAKQGAIEAGRLGITMAIFSALLVVGISWVNAKVPQLAAHVARDERIALNKLYVGVLKRSIVFTVFATAALVVTHALMSKFNIPGIERFASLPVVLCLAFVTIINCFVSSAAAYMRAHKEEPMMIVSMVTGLMTVIASYYGADRGVLTMIFLYTLITLGLALPWTLIIFLRYFRKETWQDV